MQPSSPDHRLAIFQALLVTFLWSTSWVFIKIGLDDLPPLVFAGLRYTLAFICLLPFVLKRGGGKNLRNLSPGQWLLLIVLGIFMYAITQGAQFMALAKLPTVTLSLILSFTPVLVMLISTYMLSERPSRLQLAGIAIFLFGAWLYFQPVDDAFSGGLGLVYGMICLLASAIAAVIGRGVNRSGTITPATVTLVSMGSGSLLLLGSGLLLEGWPSIKPHHWLLIAWLSVVNTAFAFTLWNHTLRYLTATESSTINNTMLIQISLLAWVFLGESVAPFDVMALIIASLGVLLVQLRIKS